MQAYATTYTSPPSGIGGGWEQEGGAEDLIGDITETEYLAKAKP